MPVFDPWRTSAATMDALAALRGSEADLAKRQRARLEQLWAAARASRCYRRHYAAHGIDIDAPMPALSRLPPIDRKSLMADFDGWVTDPRVTRRAVAEHLADAARIGQPLAGAFMVWESSGTAGEPGYFVQDAAAMATYDALEAVRRDRPRSLLRSLDPWFATERLAYVGAVGGHFASHVSLLRLQAINPVMARTLRCFSILEPVSELVAALNAYAPTIVATYPTAAVMLADEYRRGRLTMRPREVWTGGETLSHCARTWISDTWSCSVRNSYGASEFLSMAWECGEGRLHLNADWVVLEPIDDAGKVVPPGETGSAVLLTNLANRVQPLIRYELGDQVRFTGETCPCGTTLPVIDVEGRQDDPLVMAGRDGERVTLLPLALSTVLEDEAGVFDFHLRQRDDHTLALRVGGSHAEAEAATARCRKALQAYAKRVGLAPVRVVGEPDLPIPRGRSGKARRIVARTPR